MRKCAFLLKALYLQQVNSPKCNIKSTKVYVHFYFVLIEQLKMHTVSNLHFHSGGVWMVSCRGSLHDLHMKSDRRLHSSFSFMLSLAWKLILTNSLGYFLWPASVWMIRLQHPDLALAKVSQEPSTRRGEVDYNVLPVIPLPILCMCLHATHLTSSLFLVIINWRNSLGVNIPQTLHKISNESRYKPSSSSFLSDPR